MYIKLFSKYNAYFSNYYYCEVYIISWTTNDTCMVKGHFWKILRNYFVNEIEWQVKCKISPCNDNIQKTPAFVNED